MGGRGSRIKPERVVTSTHVILPRYQRTGKEYVIVA